MRIKYGKGIAPETIAKHFVDFVYENGLVIGTVNIYIQTYDDEMKPMRFDDEGEYLVVEPREIAGEQYINYMSQMRRQKIRLVKGGADSKEVATDGW